MTARHRLTAMTALLCLAEHGVGNPKRCRGCKELTNPKPWWMLWPRGVLTHWNRRRRG